MKRSINRNWCENIHIYMPTYKRAGRIKTLDFIPDRWLKRFSLVVNAEEESIYRRQYSGIDIVSAKVFGIPAKRQWIVDNTVAEYVIMIDDDLTIDYRDSAGKLHAASPEHTGKMFDLLCEWLKGGFAHVGVSWRNGNNRVLHPYSEIGRSTNIMGFNTSVIRDEALRFDVIETTMEDFHMVISLLERGYPNRISFDYAWGESKSSGEGGLFVIRTGELQKRAALRLLELHPNVVRFVGRKNKAAWKGIETVNRSDVVIEWKKAYRPRAVSNVGRGIDKWL